MPATPTPAAPADAAKAITDKLDAMKAHLEQLTKDAESARKGMPLPGARRGEDSMSSRGYSYMKLFQFMSGRLPREEARVEVDIHNKLQKLWHDQYGYAKTEANSVLAPVSSQFLPQNSRDEREFADEVRDVVKAGVYGYDPAEVASIARTINKTLSWTDATAAGSLVPPPLYGEFIDVLRNNEVFAQVGASMIGMPPNGRMVYPRQTGASTAYYVGESKQITESEPTTGDVTLTAKKVASLIKVPNELFRYASISVEAFLRNDMARVMALRMDKELLEGVGSSVSPKGLINYAGITSHTASGTPADANSGYPILPEDVYKIIAKVEEQNATFKSWVMRPLMWAYLVNRRADAVTAADGKGPFMFNVWRDIAQDMNVSRLMAGVLAGYPVYKSTQISNTRTRGSGSTNNTYILGGDFSDYVLAISPTMEFAMTQQGDTAFQNDQTWLRAILPHDGAPKREASFVLVDNLLYS